MPCTVAHFKTCHPQERPLMQARRKKPYAGVQLQSTSARDFSESRKGVEFMRRTVKIRCATGPSGLAFVRSASNSILPGSIPMGGRKNKGLGSSPKTPQKTVSFLPSSSSSPSFSPQETTSFKYASPKHAKINIYTKDAFKNSGCNSAMVSETGLHNARLFYTKERPFGGGLPLYKGEKQKFSHKCQKNPAAQRVRNSPGFVRVARAVSPSTIHPL